MLTDFAQEGLVRDTNQVQTNSEGYDKVLMKGHLTLDKQDNLSSVRVVVPTFVQQDC